jgi:sensor domain CHASE-containing protein
MRLYPKMILIIACTFFAVMIVLLFSFEFTIMNSFSSLEEKYLERDVLRAEHAFNEEIHRLEQIATDWAEWDTTYDFVKTRDPQYISSNLALSTFQALKITSFILQDLNGTVIVGRSISDEKDHLTGVSPDLVRTLRQINLTPDERHSGFLEWNNSAWFFAQNPILTTHQQGPSRGTITILNPLDQNKISDISNQLLQNVTIRILTPEERMTGYPAVTGYQVAGDTIVMTRTLTDIRGSPFLLLQVQSVRDLYESGLLTRDYLFFSLLLLVLCFMGVAITLLNLIVIAPLAELNAELAQVGSSGLLSGRITTRRDDEIGDLCRSINHMLDQIEQAEEQRHATEQRLSRLIALAEEGICLVGPDNRIWFANPKLASIFAEPRMNWSVCLSRISWKASRYQRRHCWGTSQFTASCTRERKMGPSSMSKLYQHPIRLTPDRKGTCVLSVILPPLRRTRRHSSSQTKNSVCLGV